MSRRGYLHVQGRADRADVKFSHMLRRMLEYSATHMPEGWVPRP